MKSAIAVVAVVLAAVATLAQTPPRDQPRVAAIGTAVVAGLVIADDEPRVPLRRATVTLSRSGVEDIRSATTDDQGRYVFDHLPAGSYALAASKGAYLSISYGAPKPGMPGSSVTLAEGETFTAKPIALWRGAVIAGRLTDRYGQPAANGSVDVNQVVVVNGERRLRTGSRTYGMTNAHGEYRIYGLLPAEYVVSSAPPPQAVQAETTPAELAWATRGTGQVPPPARVFTYAPTMFPGTADAAGGVIITLGRGEQRLGVDFAMQLVPVSRVSGKVTGPDGQPVPGLTVLCSAKNPSPLLPPSGLPISRTSADGSFVCPQLTPGQYTLAARARVPVTATLGPPLWALAEVTVAGQDISNVVLRMQNGQQISGAVVSRATGSSANLDPTRVQVRLEAGAGAVSLSSGAPGTIGTDGSLKIDGVVPARYRVTGTAPAGWFMQSAMLAGKDVADVPFDIGVGQDIAGLVVTFSDVQTELAGLLMDGAGRPAPQLYVVLFPTDKAMWMPGSRRIRSLRSSESGAYTIAGMPSGEYYLCALTELDVSLQFEPSYLEQFVASSIKLTLAEGEKKRQDLQVVR